ncbi:MAG: DUF3788 domain-containing protein [Anaerolineae bacterium]|nr:DUF3788 domain-containing protein [Anaerolineae bacterium]
MAVGFFLDKDQQPSLDELLAAMGSAAPLWDRLVQFIADTYQMPGEWSFGGKKYGWNLWYRKSGKSLTSLYPQQGHLVAQVVLGREEGERALALSLGDHVGGMLRGTPLLHDGRWLFIPVTTETDAADVEQLLLVKRRPAKKPR